MWIRRIVNCLDAAMDRWIRPWSPPCHTLDRPCDLRLEYCERYASPDGRVYRVRRWRCKACRGGKMNAEPQPQVDNPQRKGEVLPPLQGS